MPQLLSPGMPWTCLQNVAYALPIRKCLVQSSAIVEVSSDGTTWAVLTGANTVGANTGAAFIRCPGGNAVVTCKVD